MILFNPQTTVFEAPLQSLQVPGGNTKVGIKQ